MPPVAIVTTVAVSRGLKLNMLSRAFPTLVPMRSPSVAIMPPKIKIAKISVYPAIQLTIPHGVDLSRQT